MIFNLKLKKYLTSLLVGLLLLQPVLVFAQLGEVPISHPGLGQGGILGSAASVASKAALVTATAANEACQKAEVAFNTANTIKGIAYGGLSLIGGNKTEVADLEIYKKAVDGFIKCREAVKTSLLAAATINLYDGQTKQRLNDDISIALRNLEKRRDDIETQAKIAKRGLWKGILAALLLKTTKVVSQRLVNSLTSKYKVNDVMQYADAVASNVYTAQLINDRAVDNEEQLILRSMISNPLLRTKVDNVIYQKAADALELNGQVFSARTTSADDPDFYLKMLKYGDANSHVPFLKTAYDNRATEIQTAGLSSAQNEILLGSGLKAPRTCEGNVNEQKQIDQKWAQANDKLGNRAALYEDLKNAYNTSYAQLSENEKKRLAADLKKAEADYLKAASELKAMPTSYQTTVLKICKAIASPAELVNKGIDKAFGKFADTLGDYNDNNLPFFMGWISDIGSAIGSNLIFGGDLKSTILAESGNLTSAINLGLSFVDAGAAKKNLENGIDFNVSKGSGADEYILDWNAFDVKNGDFVTIKGDGISDVQRDPITGQVLTQGSSNLPVLNRLELSGSKTIITKVGGTYVLRVYDVNEKPLSNIGSISFTPQSLQDTPNNTAKPPTVYEYTNYNDCVAKTDKAYCDANPSLYPPASKYDYASKQDCIKQTGDEAYCNANPSLYPPVLGAFVKKPSESLRGNKTETLR